ncbi:hypothetical protein Tco_1174815 [Tanacetum coccineum]
MVKMTPGYISSRLVQNSVSPTTYIPPSKRDYEIMSQPLFDEYFNPPPCAVSPDPVAVAALRPVDPVGSPLSTTIDQDVPSDTKGKTFELYTSSLLNAACKKSMNLLKKGLLVQGEAKTTSKN